MRRHSRLCLALDLLLLVLLFVGVPVLTRVAFAAAYTVTLPAALEPAFTRALAIVNAQRATQGQPALTKADVVDNVCVEELKREIRIRLSGDQAAHCQWWNNTATPAQRDAHCATAGLPVPCNPCP